jgi:hypothetical protein
MLMVSLLSPRRLCSEVGRILVQVRLWLKDLSGNFLFDILNVVTVPATFLWLLDQRN